MSHNKFSETELRESDLRKLGVSDKAIKLMKLGLPTPLGCLLPADSEEYTDSEDEDNNFTHFINKSSTQSYGESSLSELINTQLVNFSSNPWGHLLLSKNGEIVMERKTTVLSLTSSRSQFSLQSHQVIVSVR